MPHASHPDAQVGEPEAGPYLGDLGFHGSAWQQPWQAAYDRLARAERRACRRWLCGVRQVIETVDGQVEAVFGLRFPRARTAWGLWTRLAAKATAYNLSVGFKHQGEYPLFATINPLTA